MGHCYRTWRKTSIFGCNNRFSPVALPSYRWSFLQILSSKGCSLLYALFCTTIFQACFPGSIAFFVDKAKVWLIRCLKLQAITHFALWVIFTCIAFFRTVAILLAICWPILKQKLPKITKNDKKKIVDVSNHLIDTKHISVWVSAIGWATILKH